MSHEWIEGNLERAVADRIIRRNFRKLLNRAYSCHLFYAPYWHPSGSPKDHMLAKQMAKPPTSHEHHDAYHYADAAVMAAVNFRKSKLRAKFGNIASLKAEK